MVTPAQVEALPKITPAIREICDGMKEYGLSSNMWYYLEATSEPHVRKVLACRERVKQFNPPIEVLCAATDVDPNTVLMAFMQSVDRLTSYVVHSRMSGGKKPVVDALIQTASIVGPDGDTSRMLFMKATNLLPQPKGAQTLINVTQNASPQTMVVAPSPENIIKRLSDRFNALPPLEAENVFEEEDPTEA